METQKRYGDESIALSKKQKKFDYYRCYVSIAKFQVQISQPVKTL